MNDFKHFVLGYIGLFAIAYLLYLITGIKFNFKRKKKNGTR